MKITYDISPIGADPARRAGLARVAESTAERLHERLGDNVRFSATGSLWATLQTETVLSGREGWHSAMNEVGSLARRVHEAQRSCARRATDAQGLAKIMALVGNFMLTQASRTVNILRRPVAPEALEWTDLFHSSYARIPSQVRQQLPGKHILTVHDLTPLVLGTKYFSSGQIGITRRIIDSISADDWVIAVSESTKNDLCERRPISHERVFVAPNAAAPDLFYPVDDEERIQSVRRKYDVPEGTYMLTLHSMAPHKNIPRLIEGFHRLIHQQGLSDLSLVLAGGLGRSLDEVLADLSVDEEDLSRVHFTGYVADEDLAPLYSGAEAFVFPSLYEGFGLPVLEAMQCGCPVVASNTSSIPEVAGNAALLTDPYDSSSLAEAMHEVYRSPTRRKHMSNRGIEQSKKYSWESRVSKVLEVYEDIS